MTEAGGRENLAAEAVAVSVLSSVLGAQAVNLESPNDNEALSPLLEVVTDNFDEDKEMKDSYKAELQRRSSNILEEQSVKTLL